MEKKEFLSYFELCRHYLDYVGSLLNSEPKSDDVSITIFQLELVGAARHLMDYSCVLHSSICLDCIDGFLSPKVNE